MPFCIAGLTREVFATNMEFGNIGEAYELPIADNPRENVEVKQTIVVSTKLSNSNRRGIQTVNNGKQLKRQDFATYKSTIESNSYRKSFVYKDSQRLSKIDRVCDKFEYILYRRS